MKKKKIMKGKLCDLFKSYKTIIYISFLINIILLVFTCYLINSNHIYAFSGNDEYISVNDGLITLNSDINLLYGNNIKYIKEKDYEIKSYKIGYYVMKNNKLLKIITNSLELDNSIKLSELINNFNSFNIAEKNNNPHYFKKENKKLIEDNLYLVLEAKTVDGDLILSKVKLNVSKVTKH